MEEEIAATLTLTGSTATQQTLTLSPNKADPGPVPPGTIIGRYLVLSKLGAGAMGVVLAAYDPELDRKVALKLIKARSRAGPHDPAHARLRREAQALAKLAHPNVVGVHDVGIHDGQLFVGMEFVKGQTLREWMAEVETPRAWPEVLRVFAAAGRGLAAAHEAGIIHRDFKPDNVMLGKDGRVRVMDFGLARADMEDAEQSEPALASARQQASKHPQLADLTQTGTMIGTPAYMSIEQFDAKDADARSDQFGFCVALYEALHGERPFAGNTLGELLKALRSGQVREAPKGTNVPAWLRKVVVRGLSADPDARWPSMAALLDALADDPALRRRKWWAVSLAAALVGGAAWGVWSAAQQDAQFCAGFEAKLDGVWDDERRSAVQAAILSTNLSYAADTWERVEQRLDAYTQQWVNARVEACEATHRGEQSDELLDLRMACLDERLSHVRATVDVLTSADAAVVNKAVQAVDGLPTLDRCADVNALLAEIPPPEDPEVARRVAELDEQLIQARALEKTGKYEAGLAVAEPIAKQAQTLGYEPLQARAWYREGALQEKAGDFVSAEATLEQAYEASVELRMATEAANASGLLVYLVGYQLARHEDGERWAKHAKPLARAVGTDEAWADCLNYLGVLANEQGKYEEARGHHEQALAIREKALGTEHLSVASSLTNLGVVMYRMGEFEQSHAYHERALAIFEEVLGARHPYVADALSGLAGAMAEQGDLARARDYFERAMVIYEGLGPDHPDVALALNNLGGIAMAEGKHAEARGYLERVLAIDEKVLGAEHPYVASDLSNLGLLALAQGQHEDARRYSERALAINEKALGAEHPKVATYLGNLGRVAMAEGKYEEARAQHQRALTINEKVLSADHPDLVRTHADLGAALLGLGRTTDALAHLERALSLRQSEELDPMLLAFTRFALARALWAASPGASQDHTRARELAELARDGYTNAGAQAAKELQEVQTWLADHER